MESYRSLIVWQRAHQLFVAALQLTDKSNPPRTWPVFDQLRRAAISVEANIVEGYALESPLQFRKHLRIAMGSAAEAECLVRAASELNYLSADTAADLEDLLGGTMRVLRGLLRVPIKPQHGT